jgi:endonuclease/exonuclease/phosphatase family metal-dependent hydrolase
MKFFLFFFNFIIFIKNEKVNYIFSIKTQDENNKIFLILNEFGIDKKYEMKKLNLTQISLNYLKYFFYTFSIDLNDSQTYAFSIINDKNAIIQRKKILTSKELQQIKYETNLKKKKKNNFQYDIKSFNIRYENYFEISLNNSWAARKATVMNTIFKYLPDVIGFQELRLNQKLFVEKNLPLYQYIGRPRSPDYTDESNGILFNKQKFLLMDSGTFWLTETPNQVSKYESVYHYRICTWIKVFSYKFKDIIYFFNTHLEDGHLFITFLQEVNLLKRIKEITKNEGNVFVFGDFNGNDNSVWIQDVFKEGYKSFSDYFQDFRNTYHNFSGIYNNPKWKVDHLFYQNFGNSNKHFVPLFYDVLTKKENGKFPSDHFPLYAQFNLTYN